MMSMFRKLSQLSKKRVCGVLFTICLISPLFVFTVSAENIEISAEFKGMNYFRPEGDSPYYSLSLRPDFQFNLPRQGNESVLYVDVDNSASREILFSCSEFTIVSPDSNGFYGDVGFYLTYYGVLTEPSQIPAGYWGAGIIGDGSPVGYNVTIKYASGEVITTEWLVPKMFDVENTSLADGSYSKGIQYSFNINVPEHTPILRISFGPPEMGHVHWHASDPNVGYNGDIGYVIPSATLIADRTSAELKELENISNAILEQNNLSSQYFGDVISKVDSLYTEVGNLADLQEQAIQQFDDWNIVSSVPGSVQNKVDKADQVIADINSLVKPDPDLLVPSVDVNTDDISSIFAPFFENALILQLCTMVLGFAFVSYVLFGKKG